MYIIRCPVLFPFIRHKQHHSAHVMLFVLIRRSDVRWRLRGCPAVYCIKRLKRRITKQDRYVNITPQNILRCKIKYGTPVPFAPVWWKCKHIAKAVRLIRGASVLKIKPDHRGVAQQRIAFGCSNVNGV